MSALDTDFPALSPKCHHFVPSVFPELRLPRSPIPSQHCRAEQALQDSITPPAPKAFLTMPMPSVCSCPRIVPNPDNSSGQCSRLIATAALASHQPSAFRREGTKLQPLIDLSISPFRIVLINGLISVCTVKSLPPLSASWMLG